MIEAGVELSDAVAILIERRQSRSDLMWATEGREGIVLCGREFMNSLAETSFQSMIGTSGSGRTTIGVHTAPTLSA